MTAQNFTINATNIRREIALPVGSPVSVELAASSDRSAGDNSIVVAMANGPSDEISIRDERVDACIHADDARATTQAYVDKLVVAIRSKVGNAPAPQEFSADTSLSESLDSVSRADFAAGFVKRPGMYMGLPVTFDRVLAFLEGI